MSAASRSVNRPRSAVLPAAESLTAELDALTRLDLAGLRIQYRNRTGRIAPTRISRPLLLHMLAYRIQAEVFGDLGRDTRRMLDRSGSAPVADSEQPGSPRPVIAEAPARLRAGTLLRREWQDRMERVMVLDEGFAWNGTTFSSLSAVALAITGTKWNGYRFFGLRDQKTVAAPKDDHAPAALRSAPAKARVASTRSRVERSRNGPAVAGRP